MADHFQTRNLLIYIYDSVEDDDDDEPVNTKIARDLGFLDEY